MQIVELEEFTFQIDCIAKNNSPQNSNSSYQSRSSNEILNTDYHIVYIKYFYFHH